MRLIFLAGILVLLAGCTDSNTTGTDTSRSAQQLWGPCRAVAQQQASDLRAAGFDEKQQFASLFWVYDDCVQGERRTRIDSVYDRPSPNQARHAAGTLR
jgi:hypothetical protein